MVHRALFGSIERFFAVLTEHYAGRFPVWLAPVQAHVVTISERQNAWGQEVQAHLSAQGFRVDGDFSSDKLGAKIRRAQLQKIPFMLVCGDQEVEANAVAPRTRKGERLPAMELDAFTQHLTEAARIPRGGSAGKLNNHNLFEERSCMTTTGSMSHS